MQEKGQQRAKSVVVFWGVVFSSYIAFLGCIGESLITAIYWYKN